MGDTSDDRRADLFVHNGGWIGIHKSNGSSFSTPWAKGGNLGGWCIGNGDEHYPLEVNKDRKMDILVRSKGYIGIFKSTGSAYTMHWGQGSPLGNWYLK